jgi:hypothetical protein
MKIGKALASGMGLVPAALSGAFGKENAGFGLGLIPGLAYKNQYERKERKKAGQAMTPETTNTATDAQPGMKRGGKAKKMAAGGSASKRADGCAQRGKTKGRMI